MADADAPTRRRSASSSYDALEERVENQGRMIRGLAEETATQFRDFRADTSKAISELVASIKGVDTKLDVNAKAAMETQRPQYAALFVGMLTAIGVAVTIIQWQTGLHDRPVDDRLSSLRADVNTIASSYKPARDIDAQNLDLNAKIATMSLAVSDLAKGTQTQLAALADRTVSKDQFNTTLAFQKEISDLKDGFTATRRQASNERFAAIETKLATLVERKEHEFHWEQEDKDKRALNDRILELDKRFDSLTPSSSETTRRVLDRIHELEQQVYREKAKQ